MKLYRQPQGGAGIDRSSPLGARVLDAFSGPAAFTVTGKPIVKAGTVGQAAYSGGVGYKNTASAGFSFASDLTSQNGITIVFEFVQHSRTGSQVLFEHSINQNSNGGSFIFYTDNATSRLVYGNSNAGSYDAGYVALPTLGKKCTVAIRLRFTGALGNADMAIAIDGVLQTTTNTNTSVDARNFGNYSTYFLARAGTSLHADATVGMYAVLSGFGSDDDLVKLSSNPWSLFRAANSPIFVPVSGGDTYTLNAEAGSFAIAGADATLTYTSSGPTYTVTADAGALAITGNAATLAFNRALTADTANVPITGNAASLVFTPVGGPTYTLPADSAAVAVSGASTSLVRGYNLAASAGAVSISASDAALIATRKLIADAYAAVIAGADATLTYTPITYPTIGRPASDTSNIGWTASTGTDLFAMVDEVTPDALDYIVTTATGSICELALDTTAYPGTASQALKYRASSSTGNSLIVRLKNGATTIRTETQALTASDTEYTITLTSGEIAAITSGSLSVELESA